MQDTKKNKKQGSCNEGGGSSSIKKERHIVSWSQEEDDILRQQIGLHGTENWGIIASNFKDKTTRQCRRRWYTYLNSDFKKGGWSPEEDMLLCEAQKMLGNRWTEIAKVVSGRTDNAVKNRFTTLCKKRAKYEALAKENDKVSISSNNKRFANGAIENVVPAKKMRRSHIPDHPEYRQFGDRSHPQYGNQQLRYPFAQLPQSFNNVKTALQNGINNNKDIAVDDQNAKIHGTFLSKDDPKITALVQQAELLSSLALKVNAENSDSSLENAWKVVQDFLNQRKENDVQNYEICEIDIQFEDFKDLIEDLRSSNDGSQLSWSQPNMYESPATSEYSTGSVVMPSAAPEKRENMENQSSAAVQDKEIISCPNVIEGEMFTGCEDQTNSNVMLSSLSNLEFSSPLNVTPLFRSLAAGIPSPQFSESERNFLLKTLGVESPCPNNSNTGSMQPPSCKRALLQSL